MKEIHKHEHAEGTKKFKNVNFCGKNTEMKMKIRLHLRNGGTNTILFKSLGGFAEGISFNFREKMKKKGKKGFEQ